MDGMNAIVEHILAGAHNQAAQIESAAADEIQQILGKAEQACARIRHEGDIKTRGLVDGVINRAKPAKPNLNHVVPCWSPAKY